MTRFSSHLLKRKLLTQEQLEEALQHQAVYGARLGTNLVELRMLTVEQLAECLAEFHRVPLPPRPWLERPKRAAVQRVTRPLVERIRFIPMRLENNNVLHAAVLDPNDPRTLDDLRFATGCKIQPYVLPEIWMHDWLLMLFKVPRGIRHIESEPAADAKPLNAPAQNFDFQAAQAAIAAKAAKIMVPATVGVLGQGEGKPEAPLQRKTLQGGEVRVSFEAGRVSVTGDPRTILGERSKSGTLPGPTGERMSVPGEQRPNSLGELRPTQQGEPRPTAQGEARPTMQGEARPGALQALGAQPDRPPADARINSFGELRRAPPPPPTPEGRMSMPGEGRPTVQGRMNMPPDPRLFAPGERMGQPPPPPAEARVTMPEIPVPHGERASMPMDPRWPAADSIPPESEGRPPQQRATVHGVDPRQLSEFRGPAMAAPPPPPPPPPPPQAPTPTAAPVSSAGSSVRPPPMAVRSLTEVSGRVSQAHSPIYAPIPEVVPPPELPPSWEADTTRLHAPLPPRPITLEPEAPRPQPTAAVVVPAPVAPPPVKHLADLEAALLKATDREQLLDVSFEIASRFVRVVALFIVHRGMVQGVRSMENGVVRSIQGVLLPLESASKITQAIGAGLPFRMDPRERPLDARVHQLLTDKTSSEVSLFPVALKGRVVNLLYASQGIDPLGTIAFGALSLLADQMGAAYGQLILQRKSNVT